MTDSMMPDIAVSDASSNTKAAGATTSTFWDKVTLFLVKTLIVAAVFYFAIQLAVSSITSAVQEESAFLRGGPGFWHEMETKLHQFANQTDMPEEKKKKIIEDLHKISVKVSPVHRGPRGIR